MDLVSDSNSAVNFVKQGKYEQAEEIYNKLLEKYPESSLLLTLVGYMYLETQEYEKAEKQFEKAYSLSDDIKILKGLAKTKYYLLKIEEAVQLYAMLTDIEPNLSNYSVLTSLLAELICISAEGKPYAMAQKYITQAYKNFPLNANIVKNFAVLNFYTGNLKKGEELCKSALKINPKFANAWEFLGIIYESLYNDEEKARECHKQSVKYGLKDNGYFNLGISYSKDNMYKKAIYYLNKSLEYNEKNINLINREKGYCYLKQRKFRLGFKYFTRQSESKMYSKLENKWSGKSHPDKTLLVMADMCYGDHIFFVRYLPFLKNKFKKIYVQTFDNLKEIFTESFDGIEFISANLIPDYDYFVPLPHLPYYLNMDFNHIPFSEGYLKSEKFDIKSDKLKVGFCWEAGNCDVRSTIHKTVNINEFSKLFKNDYNFYSLQIGAAMDYSKYNIIDLSKNIKTFSDTAKYLKSMDVLVSVDTSVANLAGALGVKTFMLIPYYPDWRWFDNTEKTEWYDSIKIYKQTQKYNWEKEIERIIRDLEQIQV